MDMLKRFREIAADIELDDDIRDKIIQAHFKYADHPVALKIVEIIGDLKDNLKDFDELMGNTLSATNLQKVSEQQRPIITLSKKLDHFLVYPNLLVDAGTKSLDIAIINLLNINRYMSALLKSYEEDMSGVVPGANEKWKTPERIQKRLLDCIEVPTARALTRYWNMENWLKPDSVRDLAIKIDTARKPMELLFADTPEDFRIMYGSGPHSCMSHSDRGDWRFMDKVGLTATSFYAYFPYTRGAYLMKNGKVFARVVLYTTPDQDPTDMGYPAFNKAKAKVWHYGYAYNNGGDELTRALKSHGITSMANTPKGNHFVPPAGTTFKIPGIPIGDGNYGCPFPFFDNMDYRGTGFCASFDKETKEFTISYKEPGAGNVPVNNRNGYLNSADYVSGGKTCEHCGSNKSRNWRTTDDGHLYCQAACANMAGYKLAYQGNGNGIWTKGETVETLEGTHFTTIQAAIDNGYIPYAAEDNLLPEEHGKYLGARLFGNERQNCDRLGRAIYTNRDYAFENETLNVEIVKEQKNITFDPNEPLVEAA